jgi:hypothetical protein
MTMNIEIDIEKGSKELGRHYSRHYLGDIKSISNLGGQNDRPRSASSSAETENLNPSK